MNIAIDYDETYTADPVFWDAVIGLGRQLGHSFVCVTNRSRPPMPDEPQPPMAVHCSPDRYKSLTATREGLAIDVWIDDSPSSIESGHMPGWDE